MSSVRVSVPLVDGSLAEWNAGPELIDRLRRLQAEGLEGKRLIHALLTDDWGPPPVYVDINGTDKQGKRVEERIPYR